MTLGLSFFYGLDVLALAAPAMSADRDRPPGQVGGMFALGLEGVPIPAQARRLGSDIAEAGPLPMRPGPWTERQGEVDLPGVMPTLAGGLPPVVMSDASESRPADALVPGPDDADPDSAAISIPEGADRPSHADSTVAAGDVAPPTGHPSGTDGSNPSDPETVAAPAETETQPSGPAIPGVLWGLPDGAAATLAAPAGPDPVPPPVPAAPPMVAPPGGRGLPAPLRAAAPLGTLPAMTAQINTPPPIPDQRETVDIKRAGPASQGVGAVPSAQGRPPDKSPATQPFIQNGAGLGPQSRQSPDRPESSDAGSDRVPIAKAATDPRPSPPPPTASGSLAGPSDLLPVRSDLSVVQRVGGQTDATAAAVTGAQISPGPDARLRPTPEGPQPRTRGADLGGRVSAPSTPEPAALLQPAPAPPDPPTRVVQTDTPIPLPRDVTPATPSLHARLQSQVREALSSGPLPVEVVLDPPELGRLRLRLGGADQPQHVVLTVDRPETLDLMRRHGDQFLRDLRDAGWSGLSLALDSGASGSRQGHAYPARGDLPQGPVPCPAPPEPDPSLHPAPSAPTLSGIPGRVDRRL